MEDEHANTIEHSNYSKFLEQEDETIKHSTYAKFQEQKEDEDEEEALSLCDLVLNDNSTTSKCSLDETTSFSKIPSLQDSTEFFSGFSSSSSSDMCPADDIIFCGKLVPFKNKEEDQPIKILVTEQTKKPFSPSHRRRSESLSSVTRSNSVSTCSGPRRIMMRNSRSLDYRRLHDSSSSAVSTVPEVDRNFSARNVVVPPEAAAKKLMKPRWYSLVFGTMKVPTEMELGDMKNRQVRRNPSKSMFRATDPDGKVTANRNSGKVSWRILKALSCKAHSSVAVTTTFAMPQAS